jgi:zinc transport system ATP-binding protein
MEKNPPILEVSDLTISRANSNVIEDANFTVNKGDYVGVVGPNGGGKTTLILAILGVLPKTKGKIRLFGEDIESFSRWEKIAYVSQTATNFDSQFPMSAKELVALGRLKKKNMGRRLKKEDWKRVEDALEFMRISEIADKRIGELSGGQKQRVFVAKALVRDPEILFLDEPVTGVDFSTQEKFYERLSDLNSKKGTTILLVSHDLTAVFCRMSKVICVNREVNSSAITDDLEAEKLLRETYGEHFHFVYHRHECEGEFPNE